eukprot:SAG31_NODE_320_length_17748_cov_4.201881_15_plen_616_part_00
MTLEGVTLKWPVPKDNNNPTAKDKVAKATVENSSTSDHGETVLADVDIMIQAGKLTAVIGSLGIGKSTLLSSVIGELAPEAGNVKCTCGPVGYVPQRAFILSGTVRDNIKFGRSVSEAVFDWAVRAAELHEFIDSNVASNLPQGLDTLIGERGATLSGGQQQRVSIARALCGVMQSPNLAKSGSLLVLDDPLSAVDASVGSAIFENALEKYCACGGTVIMAMNQLHLAKLCDHVIYLEGGRVAQQGTFEELMDQSGVNRSVEFSELMRQFGGEDMTVDEIELKSDSHTQTAETKANAAEKNQPESTQTTSEKIAKLPASVIDTKAEKTQSAYAAFAAAMGWWRAVVYSLLLLATYVLMAFSEWWITLWIDEASVEGDVNFYRWMHGVLSGGVLVIALVGGWFFANSTVTAGKTLHHDTIKKVLYAPLWWHEENPSGNITSRFSSDLVKVDLFVSYYSDVALQIAAQLTILIAVICFALPLLIPVIVLTGLLYWKQVQIVDKAQRPIKMVANRAVAPIISNLNELLAGRELVRFAACEQFFIDRHHQAVDHYAQNEFASNAVLVRVPCRKCDWSTPLNLSQTERAVLVRADVGILDWQFCQSSSGHLRSTFGCFAT